MSGNRVAQSPGWCVQFSSLTENKLFTFIWKSQAKDNAIDMP